MAAGSGGSCGSTCRAAVGRIDTNTKLRLTRASAELAGAGGAPSGPRLARRRACLRFCGAVTTLAETATQKSSSKRAQGAAGLRAQWGRAEDSLCKPVCWWIAMLMCRSLPWLTASRQTCPRFGMGLSMRRRLPCNRTPSNPQAVQPLTSRSDSTGSGRAPNGLQGAGQRGPHARGFQMAAAEADHGRGPLASSAAWPAE